MSMLIPALAADPDPSSVSDPSTDTPPLTANGYLALRQAWGDRPSSANPEAQSTEFSSATGLLRMRSRASVSETSSQLRLVLARPRRTSTSARLVIDELYASRQLSRTALLSLGRRKIDSGSALGYSPSDLLNKFARPTPWLPGEEARAERPGRDMLALQAFGASSNIMALLARAGTDGQRGAALLHAGSTLDRWDTDVSASLDLGEQPGLGLSMSTLLNQATVAYADYAVQRLCGSATSSCTSSRSRPRDHQELTIGAQYTGWHGITLNAELWMHPIGFDLPRPASGATSSDVLATESQSTADVSKFFFRLATLPFPLGTSLHVHFEHMLLIDLSGRGTHTWSAALLDLSDRSQLSLVYERLPEAAKAEPAWQPSRQRVLLGLKALF